MAGDDLSAVIKVLNGGVLFASIGAILAVDLLVVPDAAAFALVAEDTAAASWVHPVQAAGATGGEPSHPPEGERLLARAAPRPPGVWLTKKAELLGMAKKRYFTITKGTDNIPPVFWYWEGADNVGNGQRERGSIELGLGFAFRFLSVFSLPFRRLVSFPSSIFLSVFSFPFLL